jgi:hypothetical protein
MKERTCSLPGGWVDAKGEVHREVVLSALTGREEALLAENKQNPASQVTAVLSRCIRRIGTVSPVSESIVQNLLIADRDFLLLKLRAATFGSLVQATVPCPWPDCGRKVDIDFSTDDIPVVSSEEKGPTYTMSLSPEAAFLENGELFRDLTFRLPTGAIRNCSPQWSWKMNRWPWPSCLPDAFTALGRLKLHPHRKSQGCLLWREWRSNGKCFVSLPK